MCNKMQHNKISTKFTFTESQKEEQINHFQHRVMNPKELKQEIEAVALSEKLFLEVRSAMRGEAPPIEERNLTKARKQTSPPVEAPMQKSWKERQAEKKQREKNLKKGKKLTAYGDELTAELVEQQNRQEEDIRRFVDYGYTKDDISEELEDVLKSMQMVRIHAHMFIDENYANQYAFIRETIEKGTYISRIANSENLMNQLKEKDYNLYATALYWKEFTPIVKEMMIFTNMSHGLDENGKVLTFPMEKDKKKKQDKSENKSEGRQEAAEKSDILKRVKHPDMIAEAKKRMNSLREQFKEKEEEQEANHQELLLKGFQWEVDKEVNKGKISMLLANTEEERGWLESPSLIYGSATAYEEIGQIKNLIENNASVYLSNKAIIDKMYSDIIRRFEILGEVKIRINAWEEVKCRYQKYENNPRHGAGDRLCRYATKQIDEFMKINSNTGDNLTGIRNALVILLKGKLPNMLDQAILETYGYKIADQLLMNDSPEYAASMFKEAEQDIIFQEKMDREIVVLEELEKAAAYNSMERKLSGLNFNEAPTNTLDEQGKQMSGEDKFFFGMTKKEERQYKIVNREEMIFSLLDKYRDKETYGDVLDGGVVSNLGNITGNVYIKGLVFKRLMVNLTGIAGEGWSRRQLEDMCDDLLAGCRIRTLDQKEKYGNLTPEEKIEQRAYNDADVEERDARFDRGMLQLKNIQLTQLRRLKDKYGLYGSQLHPEDFAKRMGLEFFDDFALDQDVMQMLTDGAKYFDFEHNAQDREYRDLANYYHNVYEILFTYFNAPPDIKEWARTEHLPKLQCNELAKNLEEELAVLGAAGFTVAEETAYRRKIIRDNKIKNEKTLFGRFKADFEDELAMEVEVLDYMEEVASRNSMEKKFENLNFNQSPERTKGMGMKKKSYLGRRKMPNELTLCKGREDLIDIFDSEFMDESLYGDYYTAGRDSFANASGTESLESGLIPMRMLSELVGALGGEKTTEELASMMRKLLCCGRYRQLKAKKELTKEEQEEFNSYTKERIEELDNTFDQGVQELKQLQLENLRRIRDKYGRYPSQLHPEDFIERVGLEYFDEMSFIQDVGQTLTGKYYDRENPDDQELNVLADYYRDTYIFIRAYFLQTDMDYSTEEFKPDIQNFNDFIKYQYIPLQEINIGSHGFTDAEQEAYQQKLRERKPDRLIGRFH